jgi:hypothetical protein
MAVIIQLRRDTAANWTSNDPILAQGELGLETDTNLIKAGDGSTVWSSLDYTNEFSIEDGSVTYEKVASDLTASSDNSSTTISSTLTLTLSGGGISRGLNISEDCVISLDGLQLNKTFKAEFIISNSSTVTFPSYCSILDGSAEMSGTDGTYYVYFDCWSSETDDELVLISIAQI